MATEESIVQHVTSLEKEILGEAEAPHSLQYEDESSLETLRAVLDMAVEDDEVTRD